MRPGSGPVPWRRRGPASRSGSMTWLATSVAAVRGAGAGARSAVCAVSPADHLRPPGRRTQPLLHPGGLLRRSRTAPGRAVRHRRQRGRGPRRPPRRTGSADRPAPRVTGVPGGHRPGPRRHHGPAATHRDRGLRHPADRLLAPQPQGPLRRQADRDRNHRQPAPAPAILPQLADTRGCWRPRRLASGWADRQEPAGCVSRRGRGRAGSARPRSAGARFPCPGRRTWQD